MIAFEYDTMEVLWTSQQGVAEKLQLRDASNKYLHKIIISV